MTFRALSSSKGVLAQSHYFLALCDSTYYSSFLYSMSIRSPRSQNSATQQHQPSALRPWPWGASRIKMWTVLKFDFPKLLVISHFSHLPLNERRWKDTTGNQSCLIGLAPARSQVQVLNYITPLIVTASRTRGPISNNAQCLLVLCKWCTGRAVVSLPQQWSPFESVNVWESLFEPGRLSQSARRKQIAFWIRNLEFGSCSSSSHLISSYYL